MTQILLGILEDNINLLAITDLYTLTGTYNIEWFAYPYGRNFDFWGSNQPLIWGPFSLLARTIGSIHTYNFFLVLSYVLTGFFSFKLFKKFKLSSLIAVVLALIFTFSPFLYYQGRSHIDLAQIWVFAVTAILLLDINKPRRPVFLAFFLAFTTLISNYLAYIAFLFVFSFFSVKLIGCLITRKEIVPTIKQSLTVLFISVVTIIIFIAPYFYNAYLSNDISTDIATFIPKNNIENFFYFSSRPWYYFLPSSENPWFGDLSKDAVQNLQSKGIWLANDYFTSEHSASFLGWTNFIFAILGIIYIYKKIKSGLNKNMYRDSIFLGITAILLIILTMPPYFTISLNKIYMPSFLLWKVFPMFRALSRIAIVILMIQLIFTGFGLTYFLELLRKHVIKIQNDQKWQLVSTFVLLPILVFSLMQFYVPIKITYSGETPEVYEYINKNTPQNSVIAVYPYSATGDAVFWMKTHQRPLVNPRDHKDQSRGFDSKEFTGNLTTEEGIQAAKDLGATHLLVFKNIGKDRTEEVELIEQINGVTRVKEFDFSNESNFTWPENLKLIEIENLSNTRKNSAILYRLQ